LGTAYQYGRLFLPVFRAIKEIKQKLNEEDKQIDGKENGKPVKQAADMTKNPV